MPSTIDQAPKLLRRDVPAKKARAAPPRAAGAGPAVRAGTGLRAARVMSVMILLLMVVASAGGLWIGGLYQDPASVVAMLRAYDLVTLVVVVPALAVALLPSLRGSPGARLVWLSALAYAVYDYATYVFGSAFNDLFLVHIALFSLSVFALALALANLDVASIAAGFRAGTPTRSVSVLLALPTVGLAAMWSFYALRFAFTGAAPGESLLVLPSASVHLGYVLDLALLVPGTPSRPCCCGGGLPAGSCWRP
jgi:hypothetical protein